MSRYIKHKKYDNTIWINKPKRTYIIETDRGTFRVEREYLDYKKTVTELIKAGYKDIKINYLGYVIRGC